MEINLQGENVEVMGFSTFILCKLHIKILQA